jgi:hypothetical protein
MPRGIEIGQSLFVRPVGVHDPPVHADRARLEVGHVDEGFVIGGEVGVLVVALLIGMRERGEGAGKERRWKNREIRKERERRDTSVVNLLISL